jgi:hypothetical protein
MTSLATPQLMLNFEPALPERFRTLREFIAHRVQVQARPAKTIAGDMDMSPSTLSRKLAPGDGDTQRFNVDDLELYIATTGDTTAIEYLAAKFLQGDDARRVRAVARLEALLPDLVSALAAARGAA